MTNLQDGNPVIERGVRLYVRDLLGVNSDVTMHIISSLSSMDEANRLFAISGCGGNSSFGRTAHI